MRAKLVFLGVSIAAGCNLLIGGHAGKLDTGSGGATSTGSGSCWQLAQLALGGQHTCARKTDGTLWCWGYNGYGQLGDGTTMDEHTPVQVVNLSCP